MFVCFCLCLFVGNRFRLNQWLLWLLYGTFLGLLVESHALRLLLHSSTHNGLLLGGNFLWLVLLLLLCLIGSLKFQLICDGGWEL